jgi:DNA helicase IV
MSRAPNHREQEIIDALSAAVAQASQVLPDFATSCFAHIRIQNDGSQSPLELFLGNQTLLREEVSLIDWRHAPLAAVFFGNREGTRYEVESEGRLLVGALRERNLLHFDDNTLVAIERPEAVFRRGAGPVWQVEPRQSEPILSPGGGTGQASPFAVELDPVQRRAVEHAAGQPLLVLGEAGFGKTTVAMHRLAHLERTGRDPKARALVLVPTEGLRRLCRLLLDRLGVRRAHVETFDSWVAMQARQVFARLPERLSDETSVATMRLKRHPALRNALPDFVSAPRRKGGRRPKTTVREDLLRLFGDRDLLASVVEASGGEIPTAAIQKTAEHTRVQFSRTTEQKYAGASEDSLTTVDGLAIDAGTPMGDAHSIDAEDFPVMFALNHLRTGSDTTRRGRLSRYERVVIDEAQELAPLELELVGRAVRPGGTLTVSGDENQQVDDTAYFDSWATAMTELGAQKFEQIVLQESYRCPPEITDLARHLIGRANAAATSRTSSEAPPILRTRAANECHLCALLIDQLNAFLDAEAAATIAIICRTAAVARQMEKNLARGLYARLALDGDFDFKPGVVVTCVGEVKGLEFDIVVVPDASSAVYPDKPDARRALYVAVTRAIRQLWLLTPGAWSPLAHSRPPAQRRESSTEAS